MEFIDEAEKVDEAEKFDVEKVVETEKVEAKKVDDTGMVEDNGKINDNNKIDGNSKVDDSSKIDDSGKIDENGNSKIIVSATILSEETITASEGETHTPTPAQIVKDCKLADSEDEMLYEVASLTEMVDATNLEAFDKSQEISNSRKVVHLSKQPKEVTFRVQDQGSKQSKEVTFRVQGSGNITDKNNSTTLRTKVNESNQTKENIIVGKGVLETSLAAGSNLTTPK